MGEKPAVAAEECSALGTPGRTIESFPVSEVKLGDLAVARALPVRNRRLVGPWCFLDRFGPLSFAGGNRWMWRRTRTSACRQSPG